MKYINDARPLKPTRNPILILLPGLLHITWLTKVTKLLLSDELWAVGVEVDGADGQPAAQHV